MWSTVLMLVVVALAGWAVASVLRAPRPRPGPLVEWEHWLSDSGLRPVVPRTQAVAAPTTALGRHPSEVERAAIGRARDGALLVVARLVDNTTVIAAHRPGPVPSGEATALADGWQVRLTGGSLQAAWNEAQWLRTGYAPSR